LLCDEKSNLDVGANNNKDAAAEDFFFLEKKILVTVIDSITMRTSGSKHSFILFFTCAQFIINRMETGGLLKVYVFARAKLQLLVEHLMSILFLFIYSPRRKDLKDFL